MEVHIKTLILIATLLFGSQAFAKTNCEITIDNLTDAARGLGIFQAKLASVKGQIKGLKSSSDVDADFLKQLGVKSLTQAELEEVEADLLEENQKQIQKLEEEKRKLEQRVKYFNLKVREKQNLVKNYC